MQRPRCSMNCPKMRRSTVPMRRSRSRAMRVMRVLSWEWAGVRASGRVRVAPAPGLERRECTIVPGSRDLERRTGAMNRHCGAMLVTLTASLLFTGALFAAGKPRAVVEETIRDVGRILKGDKMTQEFSIQNGGDAPLEIKAWTSCSCTVA